MKKALVLVCSLLLAVSIVGCTGAQVKSPGSVHENAQAVQEAQGDEAALVKGVVESFGQKLQMVSLVAPEDVLKESMVEHYGEYVAPALMEQWLADPLNAPGRLTSSPWPDRIEILGMEQLSAESYEVKGEIVEVTSADGGGNAAKRPITLRVEKVDGKWLITGAEMGE